MNAGAGAGVGTQIKMADTPEIEYAPIGFDNTIYYRWNLQLELKAEATAREYILDYKYNGMKSIHYNTNQTKPVETYILMKIYHILQGSGVDMITRSILKKKDKTAVILDFYKVPEARLQVIRLVQAEQRDNLPQNLNAGAGAGIGTQE